MNSHGARKILLTREELYTRVWSVPLRQLAREFGISDVALGRMCRRIHANLQPGGRRDESELLVKVGMGKE